MPMMIEPDKINKESSPNLFMIVLSEKFIFFILALPLKI